MASAQPFAASPVTTRAMNLSAFTGRSTRRLPAEFGLVWVERIWTWCELDGRVNAMAWALQQEFGVLKGDRIVVQSQNCNQMIESMFACFRLGAIWVPTN